MNRRICILGGLLVLLGAGHWAVALVVTEEQARGNSKDKDIGYFIVQTRDGYVCHNVDGKEGLNPVTPEAFAALKAGELKSAECFDLSKDPSNPRRNEVDLHAVNFSGVKLAGANLSGANLEVARSIKIFRRRPCGR